MKVMEVGMARVLLTLLGIVLLALGIWMAVNWWAAVKLVLLGLLIIIVILTGVVMLVFGISEIIGASSKEE